MHRIAGAVYNPQAVRGFNKQLDQELQPLVRQIQGIVVGAATLKRDGVQIIPPNQENAVLAEVGNLVLRFFVGEDLRSPFAADGVTPLAPYPRILNNWLTWVTYQVVKKHSDYMKKKLPEDIHRWLLIRSLREQYTPQYEAPHIWVDARGYKLSDRIWQSGIETRRKVDALLSDGIRNGRGALDMAKDLEDFLLPSRKGITTVKPYGSRANTSAMTLARSEITRAHSTAAHEAALDNPFVDGWEWITTTAHFKQDECDQLATLNYDGTRYKEPYPLDGHEPICVIDSHPQCTCVNASSVSRSSDDVIGELRDIMQQGEAAPITPVDGLGFVRRLLGGILASLVLKNIVNKVSR